MIKIKDQSQKIISRLVWILDCSNYYLKNKKTKATNKDEPRNNQKVKNNRKLEQWEIYNTYHGPLSQKWIDGRYQSSILYVMLTQVISNLLPGFRVVLESIHNNP